MKINKSKEAADPKIANQSLPDGGMKYYTFFENSIDAILLTTQEGQLLAVNKAACNLFGYSEEELIQLGRTGIEDASDPRLSAIWRETKLKGKARGEGMFLKKDHTSFEAEISTSTFKNSQGQEVGSMIIRDITERKKIENDIRFQALLLHHVGQAIIATDLQSNVIYWNHEAERIYGWSAAQAMGKNIITLTPAETTQEQAAELMKKLSQGESWSGAFLVKRKDGKNFLAYVTDSPILDSNGRLIGIMGISRDITERRQTEETLYTLSTAVEQTMDTVIITDRQGSIEYVNHAFEAITGYKAEEVLGKSSRILVSGIKGPKNYKAMWDTILSGKVFRGEFVNKKKNGQLFYELKTISPIFDNKGIITHFVATGVDISHQKHTEQALLESEKLYLNLFENMLNGLAYCEMIFDQDTPHDFVFLAVNKSFERLTGLKEVTGKKVSELIPGIRESDPLLVETFGRVALTGHPETFEIYLNSLKMWFSMSVYSPRKNYFVALFDVITERKNAEEVLRQSEAKFRQLITSLPDSVFVVDAQGRIVYCNQLAMKTFQYTQDEMIGLLVETLIPHRFRTHHIELRNEYIARPTSIVMGEGKEMFALRKDESEFPAEMMLEPVEINNNQFTLTIVRDITDRKQAQNELIQAKEKAEESDRLKSAFLANMSHEVRTPLNGIIGFSELMTVPDYDEKQKNVFIRHIINNGNNLLTIISDILDISKIESGEMKIYSTQLNAIKCITHIKEQFSFQAEAKDLELKLSLTDIKEDTVIYADADRLDQILNNLVSNAIKFTAKGSIEIGCQPWGNRIEFYVRDTGIGIPEEYQDKIFDRFRQVESEKSRKYGGNGLGLAICKNLVELMGGQIWVESEPGKGTTIYFTIPSQDETKENRRSPLHNMKAGSGSL